MWGTRLFFLEYGLRNHGDIDVKTPTCNDGTWGTRHLGDVAALIIVFIVCTALSAKIFRWE